MKKAMLINCLLILSALNLFSQQNDFPILKGPYLGQKLPGLEPVRFGAGILSNNNTEFNIAFSPDANEIFYSLTNIDKEKDQIMYLKLTNGSWTKPRIASFSGIFDDCDVSISPDGKYLFFNSIGRSAPNSQIEPNRNYMWYMFKQEMSWSEPQLIDYPGNAGGVFPILTLDGILYFSSRLNNSFGRADIYCSRFINGKFREPENLGNRINIYHPVI